MSTELYRKHRPRSFKTVVGNEATVSSLKNMLANKRLPHVLLFHGPAGCGKTTLGRIVASALDCSSMDFREINCASANGVGDVRDIERVVRLAPTGGSTRVWLWDECHMLTSQAQNAALKMLEDGMPDHTYFILCTTDPSKLLKTIRSRCSDMPVKPLSEREMAKMLARVCKREKFSVTEEVVEKICECSNGSSRTALVFLEKCMNLPEDQHLNAVEAEADKQEGIALCRALIGKKSWSTVAGILKGLEGDPEGIRRNVLGYARAVLLNSGNGLAYHIITCFEEPFYNSGAPGLARACYECVYPPED